MADKIPVPALYNALSDIALLREAVTSLASDVVDAEAAHMMARLDSAERQGFRLIERVEIELRLQRH